MRFFIVLCCSLFALTTSAQKNLFEQIDKPNDLDKSQEGILKFIKPLSEPENYYYFKVNTLSESEREGGKISISLPNTEYQNLEFTIQDASYIDEGDYSFSANNELGEITWLSQHGGFIGTISFLEEAFSIYPFGKDKIVIFKNEHRRLEKAICAHGSESNDGQERSVLAVDCETSNCGTALVDVLILLTPGAKTWISNNLGSWGLLALMYNTSIMTNTALSNSGHSNKQVRTRYLDFTPNFSIISNIVTTTDNLAGDATVNSLRAQQGGDIVFLLTDQIFTGAWGFAKDGVNSSNFGGKFATASVQYLQSSIYTFTHELGHLFGADHNFPHNNGNNTSEYCARGHIMGASLPSPSTTTKSRTIMSLEQVVGQTRIQHFSNPNISFGGQPTGVKNQDDNAKRIGATMCKIANMLPSPTWSISNIKLGNNAISSCTSSSGQQVYSVDVNNPLSWFTSSPGITGLPPYSYQWAIGPTQAQQTPIGTNSPCITIDISSFSNTRLLTVKVTSSDMKVLGVLRAISMSSPFSSNGVNSKIVSNHSVDDDINVYPNPMNSDYCNIVLSKEVLQQSKTIAITDNLGRDIKVIKVSDENFIEVKLDDTYNGLYFVKYFKNNQFYVKKLIIQR